MFSVFFICEIALTNVRFYTFIQGFNLSNVLCQTYKTFSFVAQMDYGDELDVTGDDDDDYEYGRNNSRGYQSLSDWSTRSRLHYYNSTCDLPHMAPVKVQAKESVSSPLFCLIKLDDFILL